MSEVYHSLAGGSLSQDWTTTTLVTVNDNWAGVPSIQGFLGQNITIFADTNPTTLTIDSFVALDLDVIANQSSTAITNGGVAEFDTIANPTIALQGSGTADVPHIILYLDSTGRQNVNLQFTARDIDATTDNAVQQLNVQYRVGNSGAWSNVTGGYFADVTTGPSLATQTTAVNLTLPAAANNQAQIQIRIMTTNATGNDEWVGLDDIVVSSSAVDAAPPTLSSSSPADDAVNVTAGGNIVLTFNENVQMVTAGGAIELRRSSDNSLVQSFTSANVGGTVTIAGAVITINPTADLLPGEGYYITVAANAVEDTAGNDFAGFAAATTLNFTAAAALSATLSIDDVSIAEGDAGTSVLTFTVARSNNTTAFSVDYTTADGTATTGDSDYVLTANTLNFTAGGALTQTISVTINGDTAIEPNEAFAVNLANIVNGTGTTTFTDASGQGTITNDDAAPSVSINSVSIAEGNAGTQTLTFTVTRTGGTGAFAVDFASANGTATLADLDYAANAGTLNFAGGENSKTIDITINGDTAVEANEAFTVTLTNATAGAVIGTAAGTGTISNDDFTLIHDIQGAAHLSPMAGSSRSIEGIVTGVFNTGSSRGYYVQEEDADADADIGTSEGIFVFTGAVAVTVAAGDKVQVTGTVTEFRSATPTPSSNNLTLTQLTAATATVISAGNALPTAIVVGDTGRNPVSSVLGDDPETGVFNAATEAIDFWESLEGMRVTLDNPTAAGPFRNNFGEIMVLPNGGEADSLNARGGVTIRETSAAGTNPALQTFDFNGERIQIDDNLDGGSTAALTNTIAVGDQYADITGVVTYGFGFYEVNINYALTTLTPSTLTQESTTLATQPERIRLASFNVENLSPVGTLFSAGETTVQQKFNDLAAAIVNRLGAPELIALQEVQDNDGITGGTGSAVTSASVTLTALLAAINAAGGPQYTAIDAPPAIAHDEGGAPGGNIRVAYLYRADILAPVTALTDVAANIKQYNGARIGDGNADFAATRHSVPIEWRTVADPLQTGSTFWTINNHFSSKGGSGALTGTNADGLLWDEPVNGSATKREGQAIAVNAYIDGILADGNALNDRIITAGDFNDFQFFPVTNLASGAITRTAAGNTTTTPSTFALGAAVMTSMMMSLPEAERYTYSFDGNAQALDHILVTNNLFASTTLDIIHMNSEFNSTTQLSDHDPSEISFLAVTSLGLATAGADVLNEAAYVAAYGAEFGSLAGANKIDGLGGDDSITAGGGNDTVLGGDGADTVFGGAGNDSLAGGNQDDYLYGEAGANTLSGNAGADHLYSGSGADSFDGGAEFDYAHYDTSAEGVLATIFNNLIYHTSQAIGDTFTAVEGLAGSAFSDLLYGDNAVNALIGNGGDDYLYGNGGADSLLGGEGSDNLFGGDGVDDINGGNDYDFARYDFSASGLLIDASLMSSSTGEAAFDTLISIEGILATGFDDTIRGTSSHESLYGLGGADQIRGLGGADYLVGGAGADQFIFDIPEDGFDTINDFTAGLDKIGIAASGFGGGLIAGGSVAGAFTLGAAPVGTGAQFYYTGIDLHWDADGTGAGANFLIARLTGSPLLTAGDFILL